MDLVYITGPSSDVELIYSLRSMDKHLQGIDRLIIVGHAPDYIRDRVHIPADNPYEWNRAKNIYLKILRAAMDPDTSSEFIVCSDDYYLLTDYKAATFPYYHCGDLN